ncbi:MAG: NAD(P)-binding domain-containing protein [bacterium]|nr:NAD(P)-dependent oxidoreductase [Gammaproteobacteria bacterium]HIL96460.1 NAD(P)-dependent oxidoreductase [Pseudomonadales bacterium]
MSEKIFVVGLGNMGAALARTLVEADYQVTVWNRTGSKAEALIKEGASLAKSVAEGISANDLVVICLGTYEDSLSALNQCPNLSGKTLIQLTTASADNARDMQNWVQQKGGLYLDGAILSFPSEIGSPECTLLMAGSEVAWSAGETIVKTLGPASQYMGDNIAAPAALDFALILPSLALMMAVIQGIHTLEGAGVSTETYAGMVAPLFGSFGPTITDMAIKIESQEFSDTEASLGVWQAAIEHASASFRAEGKNLEFADAVNALLTSAVAEGHGADDLTALIKYMRQPSR